MKIEQYLERNTKNALEFDMNFNFILKLFLSLKSFFNLAN